MMGPVLFQHGLQGIPPEVSGGGHINNIINIIMGQLQGSASCGDQRLAPFLFIEKGADRLVIDIKHIVWSLTLNTREPIVWSLGRQATGK
jgi:hypothetical protein